MENTNFGEDKDTGRGSVPIRKDELEELFTILNEVELQIDVIRKRLELINSRLRRKNAKSKGKKDN